MSEFPTELTVKATVSDMDVALLMLADYVEKVASFTDVVNVDIKLAYPGGMVTWADDPRSAADGGGAA